MSEVYSAPRVTGTAARLPRLGMMPGMALDLTTTNSTGEPWDFNDPARRDEAEKLLNEQRPQLLIGSPICTAFSNIQKFNEAKRDPTIVAAETDVPFVPATDRQRSLSLTRTPEIGQVMARTRDHEYIAARGC